MSAIWLSLWLVPMIAITAVLGMDHTFSEIGAFFSKMAVVTFGGAYAVLAYMAQQAVETYGWLRRRTLQRKNMMAANYRHIGGLENRLGRHYSRFSSSGPAAPLAAQSLARRKSRNGGSNRRS
jgi:hypothetical protein